jgi:hypothetical protein
MTKPIAARIWTAETIEKYIEAAFAPAPSDSEDDQRPARAVRENRKADDLTDAIALFGIEDDENPGVRTIESTRFRDKPDNVSRWLAANADAAAIKFADEINLAAAAKVAAEVELENARQARLIDKRQRSRLRIKREDGDEIAEDMALAKHLRHLRDEALPADPKLFAEMAKRDDEIMGRRAPHNAEMITHILLDHLIEVEADPKVERARQIVLCWLRSKRSGDSMRKFCEAKGIVLNELTRHREKYFGALADKLAEAPTAPPRPIIKVYASRDIVWGDAAHDEYKRSPEKTQRMIEGGKLPVARLAGFVCANRKLLKNRKVLNPRQPVAALAA